MSFVRPTGVLLAAILLAPCFSFGGEEPPQRPRRSYGPRQVAHDAGYLARRPFTLGPRGRRKLLAVAGATLFLYAVREDVRDFVQDHRSEGRSRFVNDARTMGKGAFAPAVALAAFGASFATGEERERETALLVAESAAFSAVLAYTGSFALAAERPEDGDSVTWFDTDGRGVSLDVALAASVIPPLRRQYLRVRPEDGRGKRFWKRSATTLLYTGAALTAYQRMDADKHWAPDVFLGMATGLSVGQALCDAHEDRARRQSRLRWSVAPAGAGIVLSIDLGRRSGAR